MRGLVLNLVVFDGDDVAFIDAMRAELHTVGRRSTDNCYIENRSVS